ncbi:MAG TPA: DUF1573 domain-containing protein [Verrucomicrobiae bacterium]|nr:DUF1573 domain-containing protein [Verrucomicrobiae bacterium]
MNHAYRWGLLAALLGGTAVRAEGTPKIQFDRTSYDFGVTSLVESVTGTFTFQNTGDADLELEKPKPSCGCTVASFTSEKLRPGEKGELVFTIQLGTAAHQRLSKLITVSSNDPEHPVLQLGIMVQTKSVLTAEPPSINLGTLRLGAVTNATVMIRRNDGKKLTITKVEASSDLMAATAKPTGDGDPQAARLQVEFKATGLPRRFSEQIRLSTDDSVGAVLTVFVSARLLGDIELEPETLSWGMPDPTNWKDEDTEVILSRSIIITSRQTERPLLLRNVSCSRKEVEVKLVTLQKGQEYEIVATLPKRLTKTLEGTINFETNLPSLPKVEVPLTISVWTP